MATLPIFEKLWEDYISLNPEALKIYRLLSDQHEKVLNDHVAFRTFNLPGIGLSTLAKHFIELGYSEKNDYIFKEKKLYAKHYEHLDINQPKVFISELELDKVSPFIRTTIEKVFENFDYSKASSPEFLCSGATWKRSYQTYEALYKESEYAAWTYAYGFRANHFTVNVNQLKKFSDLPKLNNFIKTNGFQLNQSGGEIKGTPEEMLEQSSTMAKDVAIEFEDGTHKIPACYYEFAKRYPMNDGKLYQGFIAKSADKIFESTNKT
ncbi:MAG: DUF1338 domain-containing protein [Bdellovibrionaceae bacterium]|nr:DUF1338 domain-containing protein [Pseudobdellovibrionaceae bacterium]